MEKRVDLSQIAIVIPVYNHSATLREVVVRALNVHPHVMVVDDGSTDSGADVLSGLDIHLIKHDINMGKGVAILTATREAAKKGYTHIVTLDADNQHAPEDFSLFVPQIMENPHTIFVGKRDFSSPDVPGHSRFGRKFSNFWYRLQTGKKIGDSQSGYRAYPIEVLNALNLKETRYSFEIEVLVKSAWAGIPVLDIDISTYYPPGKERITHFNLFWDNFRLSVLNTKLTIRSFLPIPHKKFDENGKQNRFSLLHPIKSIKSLLGENISPRHLALSGSLGMFLGTLPLYGIQTLLVLFLSGFFRLNKVVALAINQLCMPPIVPALCIETGYYIRNGEFLTEISITTLGYQCWDRIVDWALGALVLAPVFSLITGGTLYATALVVKKSTRSSMEEKENTTKWSSSSIGSRFQHNIFYMLIKIGGRRVAYLLLYVVVFYYALLVPSTRKKTDPYLGRRFPGAKVFGRFFNRYNMILELGKGLVDRAVVGILGPDSINVAFEQQHELLNLLQQNDGFILLMSHVGCWQAAMSSLGHLNKPINLLMQMNDEDVDKHYYEHQGSDSPFKIIDPSGYLGGTIDMMNALKNGEILCIMGDRVFGGAETTIEFDFLGGPVPFPYSAYRIASASKKPVVILFSYKTGSDSYEIKLSDVIHVPDRLGKKGEAYRPYVGRFVDSLESFTDDYPFQFFNFYDMWDINEGDDQSLSRNQGLEQQI